METAADTSGGVGSQADDKQTTFHRDRLQRRLARASLSPGCNRSIMAAARENQFLINTVAGEHVLMMSRGPAERESLEDEEINWTNSVTGRQCGTRRSQMWARSGHCRNRRDVGVRWAPM